MAVRPVGTSGSQFSKWLKSPHENAEKASHSVCKIMPGPFRCLGFGFPSNFHPISFEIRPLKSAWNFSIFFPEPQMPSRAAGVFYRAVSQQKLMLSCSNFTILQAAKVCQFARNGFPKCLSERFVSILDRCRFSKPFFVDKRPQKATKGHKIPPKTVKISKIHIGFQTAKVKKFARNGFPKWQKSFRKGF